MEKLVLRVIAEGREISWLRENVELREGCGQSPLVWEMGGGGMLCASRVGERMGVLGESSMGEGGGDGDV